MPFSAGGLPIETQDFAENQDQNHSDEDPGLLHVRSDTRIAHDTDTVSGGKPCHTDCQAATEMQEAAVTGSVC